MKKLLYLLTATMMITSSSPLIIYLNTNINFKNQVIKAYPPNSVRNIIRNFNEGKDMEEYEKDKIVQKLLDEKAIEFYHTFFDAKEGSLISLKMELKNEVILQTFTDTFTNKTANNQTFQTQAYEKEVSDTHTFSIGLSEKVSFKTKFKIPFLVNQELTAEVSASQNWTSSKTVKEKLINPSQPFIVSPYSIGKAIYVIKQGTFHNQGVLRFAVNLKTDYFDLPNFSRSPENNEVQWIWYRFRMSQIIEDQVHMGFADYLKLDSLEYSIISADDPYKPTKAYLNLPITWDSQGGKMEVTFEEEAIKF